MKMIGELGKLVDPLNPTEDLLEDVPTATESIPLSETEDDIFQSQNPLVQYDKFAQVASAGKEVKRESVSVGAEICQICLIDELGSQPIYKLECGHEFHLRCLAKCIGK